MVKFEILNRKLGFLFNIKAREEILPQAYFYYSEDEISLRNAEIGQKDNFITIRK
jgi:hypothetical protein